MKQVLGILSLLENQEKYKTIEIIHTIKKERDDDILSRITEIINGKGGGNVIFVSCEKLDSLGVSGAQTYDVLVTIFYAAEIDVLPRDFIDSVAHNSISLEHYANDKKCAVYSDKTGFLVFKDANNDEKLVAIYVWKQRPSSGDM